MKLCKMSAPRVPYICCVAVCLLLLSCQSNRLDIDVSEIQIEPVKIGRFDRDFFSLNADNILQKLPELQKKYPGFADLYVRNILCPAGINDTCIPEIIHFLSDKDMRDAYDDCQKTFPDMNDIESQLTEVFRHYRYYFSDSKPPRAVSMMSGFNYAIAAADTVFAIGMEMYLGSKSRFYDMLQYPHYRRLTMRREFIVNDFIRAWMLNRFPNTNKSETLLNEMIYQGKLIYLADALMPEAHDSIKTGYTGKQLEWCVNNEGNIWGHLVKNKFLYSNDINVVAKFTGDGPFTAGFVKESPARTGVWIGWRIVQQYMDSHLNITLEQLMQETDAQKILSESKYKP